MKNILLMALMLTGCLDTSVGQCFSYNHKVYSFKIVKETSTEFIAVQTDINRNYYYGEPWVLGKYNPVHRTYFFNIACPVDKAPAPPHSPNLYKEFEEVK